MRLRLPRTPSRQNLAGSHLPRTVSNLVSPRGSLSYPFSMRRSLLGFLLFAMLPAPAILPATAIAKRHVIAPPGNSGVSQYVETVPTAQGGRPTSSLHGHGGGGAGGGGGGGFG